VDLGGALVVVSSSVLVVDSDDVENKTEENEETLPLLIRLTLLLLLLIPPTILFAIIGDRNANDVTVREEDNDRISIMRTVVPLPASVFDKDLFFDFFLISGVE